MSETEQESQSDGQNRAYIAKCGLEAPPTWAESWNENEVDDDGKFKTAKW